MSQLARVCTTPLRQPMAAWQSRRRPCGVASPPPRQIRPMLRLWWLRRLRCPLCADYTSVGDVRALFCHVSAVHAGAALSPAAITMMQALGRGVCTGSGCGALRDVAQNRCRRCRCSLPVGALAAGDVVPPRLQHEAPLAEPQYQDDAADAPLEPPTRAPAPAEAVRMPPLPDSFLERVRALSPRTILAIPHSLRARHATIAAIPLGGLQRRCGGVRRSRTGSYQVALVPRAKRTASGS